MPNKNSIFEIENCSRCGGSGKYSWCQTHGDTCFKCGGTGISYTKRGAAAFAYMKSLVMVPASDIKVGDLIRAEIISPYQITKYNATVSEINENADFKSQYYVNGELVDSPPHMAIKHTNAKLGDGVIYALPDTKIQIVPTAEQLEDLQKQAIEYQSTLTKTGKPKKK